MESKKLIFFTIIAFVSVFQIVRAMKCYDCKIGTTCTSIEEMQDKIPCMTGWQNCQTVTYEEKGKVVSVKGGCVAGPKRPDDHDCAKLDNARICTCNFHLCNGIDLGTTTTTQNTTMATQNTTTATQNTTTTTQNTTTTTQNTTTTIQNTTTATQNTTTTIQNTTTATRKTIRTTQKTNGIERLEIAIVETLVLIVFVSFKFY